MMKASKLIWSEQLLPLEEAVEAKKDHLSDLANSQQSEMQVEAKTLRQKSFTGLNQLN
jgi:hypothetical protein